LQTKVNRENAKVNLLLTETKYKQLQFNKTKECASQAFKTITGSYLFRSKSIQQLQTMLYGQTQSFSKGGGIATLQMHASRSQRIHAYSC
jgi:hypothetical protein